MLDMQGVALARISAHPERWQIAFDVAEVGLPPIPEIATTQYIGETARSQSCSQGRRSRPCATSSAAQQLLTASGSKTPHGVFVWQGAFSAPC
jgi:hypothetical protein